MVKKLFKLGWRLIGGMIRWCPLAISKLFLEGSLTAVNAKGTDFLTVRKRPKSGGESPYRLVDLMLDGAPGEIAVVVQGPLRQADGFTIESLRYYRMLCPEMNIILSTWDDEPVELLNSIRALGVDIVVSKKPAVAGRCNINFQVTSTAAGLQRAAELGCRYAAKTRSDQRLYGIAQIHSFPMYLKVFPARNAEGQQARLIGTSFFTSKIAPYYLSDFFCFGLTADMMDYWHPELDTMTLSRESFDRQYGETATFSELSQLSAEFQLLTRYIRRITRKDPTISVSSWWKLLRDRMVIIDWSMLDVYWPKYGMSEDRPDRAAELQRLVWSQVSFSEWLALYCAADNQIEDLEYLLQLNPHSLPPIRHLRRGEVALLRTRNPECGPFPDEV